MKAINSIIFIFILFIIKAEDEKQVINTCGKIGYGQPKDASQCVQSGEVCCFVQIKISDSETRRFCASAPSKISIDDVKEEIKDYTSYQITGLSCNRAYFIKNTILIPLLIIFIIF